MHEKNFYAGDKKYDNFAYYTKQNWIILKFDNFIIIKKNKNISSPWEISILKKKKKMNPNSENRIWLPAHIICPMITKSCVKYFSYITQKKLHVRYTNIFQWEKIS